MIPIMGCMSAKNVASCPEFTHAWTIIVKYYEMKQGKEYNAAPARWIKSTNRSLIDFMKCNKYTKELIR